MRNFRFDFVLWAFVIGFCLMITPQTWADTTWTLNGVNLSDGGFATGSFIDPSDGTMNTQFLTTGYSITVNGGLPAFGLSFTFDPTNSTAKLINDTPALFPVSPPLGFYGFEISLTSTATCGSGPSFGFCTDLILEADVPTGLVSSASPIVLSTIFSVDGCAGCGPGGIDLTRGLSSGSIVASTSSSPVPEPSSLVLVLCALGVLAIPAVGRRAN